MSILSTQNSKKHLSLFALAAFLCLVWGGVAAAAQVTLAWDANAEQAVTGYRVFYRTGEAGPPYEGEGLDQGPSPIDVPLGNLEDDQNPQFSITGLSQGTYYFVCTAYDDDGNESGYSNEVSLTVPADNVPPPTPTDFQAVALDANRVMLTWSNGDNGEAAYRIFRDGQLVGTTEEKIIVDSGLLASSAYAYTIEAFDLMGNTSPQSETLTVQTPMESDFNMRINCGGSGYLDSAGHQWSADTGFNGGSTASTSDPISGTLDDPLYQTERWNSNASGHLIYSFDVPNGEYQVNFYFADLYDGTAGEGLRVFDTFVEDQPLLNDLDIFARVGHDATLITPVNVVVTDGRLDIDFANQVENAKIAAIEFFMKGFSAPAPAQYQVSADAAAGGSISPAGTTTVQEGASPIFTITPDVHYHVAQVYVDNTPVGTVSSYNFDNVSGDHTIRAEFALDTYTVTANCGGDGTISPSGVKTVAYGDSLTFQITPGAHREIADLLVNEVSEGAVSSYTLSNIDRDYTLTASFVTDTHAITATAASNGSISQAGSVSVTCGQAMTYHITPDAHYHVEDVRIDGVSVGAVSSYTFENLVADHTISASFAIDAFVVTTTATGNGTISPAGEVKAPYGSSLSVLLEPDSGHIVADVLIDGKSVGAVTTPTLEDIQADHTIAVVFAPAEIVAPVFESGEIVVDQEWVHVMYRHHYSDPIVVARSLSINGGDPSVVRIRNIDPTGFEIRVQEWDYRDGWHVEEQVGYLVMERGTYTLADGTRLEASTFECNRTNSFEAVLFERAFNKAPVVVAAVASVNEADAVTGRLSEINTEGFQFGMREQESNPQDHAAETITYIAWEPSAGELDGLSFQVGRTENVVTDDFYTIGFGDGMTDAPVFLADMQTTDGGDTANIRWRRKSAASVEVQIDEEQSADEEVSHTSEVVGYMIFEPTEIDIDRDGDGLSNEDEIHLYGTDPDVADSDGDGLSDGDELAYWKDRWDGDLDDDGLNQLNDPDSDNDGVLDGTELEQGFDPADADSVLRLPTFESGDVIIDHEWTRVHFTNHYEDPVVVAGGASINGSDPAVVRIQNVDVTGFDIRIQEWDYLDDWHKEEQVSYLVMERGRYSLADGTRIEADRFENSHTDSFGQVSFRGTFNVDPVVMTTVASVNESDAITGRLYNVDIQGFMYRMQEQETSNQVHAAESVAYIAWEPSSGVLNGVSFQIGRTDDVVTHEFHTVDFQSTASVAPAFLANMQTADGGDPASLRWQRKTTDSVQIQVDEEQSLTDETEHTDEVVGFMVFSN